MKQYKIVSNTQPTIVENEVSKLMNEGWTLAGGISTVYKHEHGTNEEHIPGHVLFAQAVQKETE